MILIYLRCQRPGFSFPQPTSTDLTALAAPAARAKTTSGTQADFRRLSSPVFDASRKELFRKDEWGLIFKTADANRAYKRQKGASEWLYSV